MPSRGLADADSSLDDDRTPPPKKAIKRLIKPLVPLVGTVPMAQRRYGPQKVKLREQWLPYSGDTSRRTLRLSRAQPEHNARYAAGILVARLHQRGLQTYQQLIDSYGSKGT